MPSKALVVCALAVALLVSGAACGARPSPDSDAKGSGVLQLLLSRNGEAVRETNKDSAARQDRVHTRVSRMDKLSHLSEDGREFMTKQIMQALSEMLNSECMSNRDYQGWVDFGRRSAEE
ncbi:hypothetical protein NHX12_018903 [Muraenolepis orangiensis]|uniref:Gastrin/cholecystokinin peptide hormone domain-containing protein n=1 Tax=Muraenolepis orangiensis TaxID=630683 RepID=A0A9Q0EZV8_9TELE|nr:hypothetical protein NHX12_018903 [Muraenolepis orangiensis]